jgi:hypothetical protein
MDMDATIKGYPVNEESIQKMFREICEIQIEDDITFTFRHIGEIREGDEYTGYRVALTANYPPMAVPLKLDITTGDVITPREIRYKYKLLLEDRFISVLAYNPETVLAEKLETVISRSDQNTRPRDYYDIYILALMKADELDFEKLSVALDATAQRRGSARILEQYRDIMQMVKSSEVMQKQWKNYQKDFAYADSITFDEACDAVVKLMSRLKETATI